MRNELKKFVKAALLKTYTADTVRKGMGRAERYLRAAYGAAGESAYKSRLMEDGSREVLVSFFAHYCSEIGTQQSFNASNLSQGKAKPLFKKKT